MGHGSKCSQYRAVMLRYCMFLSPISPLIRERQPRANAKAQEPSTIKALWSSPSDHMTVHLHVSSPSSTSSG
jgi:hypothetical protein